MRGRPFSPSWAKPVRHSPRFVHDTVAITPVIGTIMILGVSAVGIGAVMAWGVPSLQDTKANTEFAGLLEQFHTFDAVSTNTMHGGSPGKASAATANLPGGHILRERGQWFMVEWYPTNIAGPSDTHLDASFSVTGYDDPDPTEVVVTNTGAALDDPRVRFETVDNKDHFPRFDLPDDTHGFPGGWQPDATVPIPIGSAEEFKTYPSRLRISDIPSEELLAEIWFFPMGALEYRRETETQGPVSVILENSAVITQRLETSDIRDKPLITKEEWRDPNGDPSDGEPRLVVLFLTLYVDDPKDPGVSAGGAGSWPLLFSLRGNNLRATSTDVVSSSISVSGPRADTWLDYYVDNYDYVREGTTNKVTLDAGPTKDDYTFVLMESLLEISLQDEGGDITPRPPPPAAGGGSNPGGNGNSGPCDQGVAQSCGWKPNGGAVQPINQGP